MGIDALLYIGFDLFWKIIMVEKRISIDSFRKA